VCVCVCVCVSTLRVWDVCTKKCTATLEGHKLGVSSAIFSFDGKYLVSGAFDKTIR
jgi:WD40 repeat protein